MLSNEINVARLIKNKGKINEFTGKPINAVFALRRDNETKLPKEFGLSVFQKYDNPQCYELIKNLFKIRDVALYCIMNVGNIRSKSDSKLIYDVLDDSAIHHPFHASIKVVDIQNIIQTNQYGEPMNYEDEEVLINLVNCVDSVVDILEKLK